MKKCSKETHIDVNQKKEVSSDSYNTSILGCVSVVKKLSRYSYLELM